MTLLAIEGQNLKNFIMVGDRLLVKPSTPQNKTRAGLYLPPNVQEKENVQTGYVVKAGPGYPLPVIGEEEEPWKNKSDQVKYIPLQAKEGDLAVYMQSGSIEIEYNKEKYHILSHSSILLLIRDEGLFE